MLCIHFRFRAQLNFPQVRVTTQDYFPVGTVVVFDATHLPFGCSVSVLLFLYQPHDLRMPLFALGVAKLLDEGHELAEWRRDRHLRGR